MIMDRAHFIWIKPLRLVEPNVIFPNNVVASDWPVDMAIDKAGGGGVQATAPTSNARLPRLQPLSECLEDSCAYIVTLRVVVLL